VAGLTADECGLAREVLGAKGLVIQFVSTAAELRPLLRRSPSGSFDCVLIDSHFGGRPGLDTAAWILQQDGAVSCILVEEAPGKPLLLRALRMGIADVLERPLDPFVLEYVVEKALLASQNKRGSSYLALQARDATRISRRIMNGEKDLPATFMPEWSKRLEQVLLPAVEAGGDFASVHPLDDHRLLFIVGDVSGHDVVSGFISSFFLGICSGMIARGAPPEAVFAHIQHFLATVWNPRAEESEVPTSLAACFAVVDFHEKTLSTCCNGFPSPILFTGELNAIRPGGASPPLGWFDGRIAPIVTTPLPEKGSLLFFSDGLLDFAKAGPCDVARADAVLGMISGDDEGDFTGGLKDDIMVLRFAWNKGAAELLRPLCGSICETSGSDDVDKCQMRWEGALNRALPLLSRDRKTEILLACREATLNVVQHAPGAGACRVAMALAGPSLLCVSFHPVKASSCVSRPGKPSGHIPFGCRIIAAYAKVREAEDGGLLLSFRLDRPIPAGH
jgi:CheY-like chemotaxis protein